MIGIDLGHETTTAVCAGELARVPSTPNPAESVERAVRELGVDGPRALVLHALEHAVLTATGLTKVAILRIGGDVADAVRPMFGWPKALRAAVLADSVIVPGATDHDGRISIPLDESAVRAFAERNRGAAFAVCGMFATLRDEQERRAAELIRAVSPESPVSCSADLGGSRLRPRENTTVLDAALSPLAARLSAELAVEDTYFLVGDGTLTALSSLEYHPARTLGARGAALLRGASAMRASSDVLLVDGDGTASAVGALADGLVTEAAEDAEFAGVPISQPLPAWHELESTDPEALAEAIDRLSPAPERTPVLAVAGTELAGAEPLRVDTGWLRAAGAAEAPVAGRGERIGPAETDPRGSAEQDARLAAMRAGAEPNGIRIAHSRSHRVPYLHTPTVRARALAIGPARGSREGVEHGG